MAVLDAEFTHDDFKTLIHILEEWETTGSAEESPQRREVAPLLKAKLLLQQNYLHVDRIPEAVIPQNTARQSKMELAEQYMRECGIWSYLESYLTDQIARIR
ncbi:hypothetical protein AB1L30_10220 [Bremerella sp. JC817]|uniref:hypothetical protein n=1 Tax=Bremerella sp. JC817 TaxID=3231756 RepID=UPI0034576F87